ncbi:MAG: hypothetical protein ACKO5A_05770 [Actinomycetota bacterium]
MTLGESPSSDVADVPAVAPVVRRRHSTEHARVGRGAQRVRRRRTTGWWAAATVAAVTALAALGWLGWQASLKITGGTPAVTDPSAPGYVAEVEPTPVDLIAVEDSAGGLAGALIVVGEPDGSGGTVIPTSSRLFVPPTETSPQLELGQVYTAGGLDALRDRLGRGVGFGFTSADAVTAADTVALSGLAGPVEVDNFENLSPAPLLTDPPIDPADAPISYRSGNLTIDGSNIVDYLSIVGRGETVDNRSLRQQQVWEALLTALASKSVAGTGGALGSVIAELLAGEYVFEQLPTVTIPQPESIFVITVPDAATLPSFTARTIAAPISAFPGQRPRTRILNGTVDPAATAPVGPKVVESGGLVASVGNAESFDVPLTRVEWVAPAAEPMARRLAEELGVEAGPATVAPTLADVIVVVGGGAG